MNRRRKAGADSFSGIIGVGFNVETVVACGNSEQSNSEGNEAEACCFGGYRTNLLLLSTRI